MVGIFNIDGQFVWQVQTDQIEVNIVTKIEW